MLNEVVNWKNSTRDFNGEEEGQAAGGMGDGVSY